MVTQNSRLLQDQTKTTLTLIPLWGFYPIVGTGIRIQLFQFETGKSLASLTSIHCGSEKNTADLRWLRAASN